MNGVAAKLDFFTLSVDTLRDTIVSVIEDEFYTENIKKMSRLYKDQPMKPLDKATWWIEYIIRNPNATHLQSHSIHMNFFTSRSLDVILVLVILVVSALILLVIIFNNVNGFCRKKIKIE